MDGMCPELWGRDIPSVKKAEMSVPLQEASNKQGGSSNNEIKE